MFHFIGCQIGEVYSIRAITRDIVFSLFVLFQRGILLYVVYQKRVVNTEIFLKVLCGSNDKARDGSRVSTV